MAILAISAYLVTALSFQANPPGAAWFAQAIIVIAFGFFVLSKNRRAPLNRAFFLLSLSYTGYLLLVYLLHMATIVGIERVKTPVWLLRNCLLLAPAATVYFTHHFLGARSKVLLALSWASLASMLPFVVLNVLGRYVTEYQVTGWTYVPANALRLYQLIHVRGAVLARSGACDVRAG